MSTKRSTTKDYGGRSHGKYTYGNGGFGNQPITKPYMVSQEEWDRIFKKEENEDNKSFK